MKRTSFHFFQCTSNRFHNQILPKEHFFKRFHQLLTRMSIFLYQIIFDQRLETIELLLPVIYFCLTVYTCPASLAAVNNLINVVLLSHQLFVNENVVV